MTRRRRPSPQARRVLETLVIAPRLWRNANDLARDTGLTSGTLYPMLRRLRDRGWIETRWRHDGDADTPLHQVCRLRPAGVRVALSLAASEPEG